jgi:hypothetical protein
MHAQEEPWPDDFGILQACMQITYDSAAGACPAGLTQGLPPASTSMTDILLDFVPNLLFAYTSAFGRDPGAEVQPAPTASPERPLPVPFAHWLHM